MEKKPVWPGLRLFEMLDDIVEGKRTGFEGLHGVTTPVAFNALYTDYDNYFCEVNDDGGFLLVLDPNVKPVVKALGKPSVMKHCWFGYNSDPVKGITAAMVAERYDNLLLKCDETLEDEKKPEWIDASGKAWKSKDDAVKEIFGPGVKLEEDDGNSVLSDEFDDECKMLAARIEKSNVTDAWLRDGVIAFDPDAAPLLNADRLELTDRLVEQLLYETDEDSDDESSDDESGDEPDEPVEPPTEERPKKRNGVAEERPTKRSRVA